MTDTSTASIRVLLVEDEAVIAMTAEDMIEEMGCILAAHAATVEEALHHVGSTDFDVALLDINLNGTMSTAVAHALRDAGKRFIFTTGYGNIGSADFDDIPVVVKPYTFVALSMALSAATDSASLF